MTDKRWLGLSVRVLLSLALVYCIYLVTTKAVAYWYFRQPTPERIRQAIRFDPRNPMYHAVLARLTLYSPEGGDLEEVIRLYEQATRLSPHQARYWAELAGAYELAGRSADARAAYERAQELFPRSPEINWKLGNFYLRAGNMRAALAAFQKVLFGDPSLRRPAFELAWRATDDAALILTEMVPPEGEIYFEYLAYLIDKQRLDPAITVWNRLLVLNLPFEPQAAFPYLDALIQHRRLDELTSAWTVLVERFPTRVRQPRFENSLITNGDFETDILQGGLGWRVWFAEGVVASIDSLTFFDGTRSLKIRFDGHHNVDYHHVLQYVPVRPNAFYRFTGYLRTQDITTDSGPRFQIQDAYDPAKLSLLSENLLGTQSWAPQQLEFKTGRDTRLLLVRFVRPLSQKFDNQIAGTTWIDRVSLMAIE